MLLAEIAYGIKTLFTIWFLFLKYNFFAFYEKYNDRSYNMFMKLDLNVDKKKEERKKYLQLSISLAEEETEGEEEEDYSCRRPG